MTTGSLERSPSPWGGYRTEAPSRSTGSYLFISAIAYVSEKDVGYLVRLVLEFPRLADEVGSDVMPDVAGRSRVRRALLYGGG